MKRLIISTLVLLQFSHAGFSQVFDSINKSKDYHSLGYQLMMDDKMADAVFHAGVELLADIGLYHVDTQRVVKFTKEEIEGLAICPGLAKLGDIQAKAGTLSEIHVALWEQEQLQKIITRVGRPGLNLGLLCTASTPGAIMECIGAGFRDASNTQIGVHVHPDQKIDWERLILAHYCNNRGITPWQSAATFLGGLCRNAADASVAMVASILGHMAFANGPLCNIFPTTIEGAWSTRETIWAICATARASERNIRIAFGGAPVPSYTWGRRDLGYYLAAVQLVAFTACGMAYAWLTSGCGAEGVKMGRIMKAAAGIKPEKADAIAQTIMNKAEEEIAKREAKNTVRQHWCNAQSTQCKHKVPKTPDNTECNQTLASFGASWLC